MPIVRPPFLYMKVKYKNDCVKPLLKKLYLYENYEFNLLVYVSPILNLGILSFFIKENNLIVIINIYHRR